MIFTLKIATLYKTSESSFCNKQIPLFGKLMFSKFSQKLVFVEFKRSEPTTWTFIFYSVQMFVTNNLFTLKTTQRFNAPFIANDTWISSGKLKIGGCNVLEGAVINI